LKQVYYGWGRNYERPLFNTCNSKMTQPWRTPNQPYLIEQHILNKNMKSDLSPRLEVF
jgi:hypothetical protein